MRILLVNPWLKTAFGDERARPVHPHLGLAYLIAVLKQAGIKAIDVYDQGLEDDTEVLCKKIDAGRPDLIGLTTFSYCYDHANELIKTIKGYTSVPLIIGGPHVSALRGEVLATTTADFAMKGESEASFVRFIEEFSESKNYARVGNLIWKNPLGSLVENQAHPLIEDLDRIPFPCYDAFHFERYNYFAARTLPIITSRGCPYGCNYCSVKLSMGRRFRARSPENVVEEMRHWVKVYKIERFDINDDCFTLNIDRAESICDLLIKEGLNIKYRLYNGIRADRVTERLLRKMKESGCIFISYGCESGNQGIINNMGKALRVERVREAVGLTNKVGIRNAVNFIIGHKGETYETAMDSLKLAKSLPTGFVNFYNAVPYPGTDLYNWATENATYMMPMQEYLGRVGYRDLVPVFDTKEFPREERIKALRQGYDLYERTIMQFTLGKFWGYLAYIATRNRVIFSVTRRIALNSKIGFYVYRLVSRRSKKD